MENAKRERKKSALRLHAAKERKHAARNRKHVAREGKHVSVKEESHARWLRRRKLKRKNLENCLARQEDVNNSPRRKKRKPQQ